MTEGIHIIERGGDHATKCKHFRGMGDKDTCEAGVPFESVRVNGQWKYRYKGDKTVYTHGACYPCMADKWNFGGATCDKREIPTAEEEAQWQRDMTESFERTMKARAAIVDATGGKRGVAGKIPCPVCGTGTLGYSVAGCNGHIWGKCSTEGCVAWME